MCMGSIQCSALVIGAQVDPPTATLQKLQFGIHDGRARRVGPPRCRSGSIWMPITTAPSRSACGGPAATSLRGGPFSRGRRSERDSAAPVTNQRITK
jgi:hypothetical protein